MNDDDRQRAYVVEVVEDEDGYLVVSPSGNNVMRCGDARSAEHYATLLSSAYQLGYKTGYRAGRRS